MLQLISLSGPLNKIAYAFLISLILATYSAHLILCDLYLTKENYFLKIKI
jgi:fructose-specific phosphotransferase system IIC component